MNATNSDILFQYLVLVSEEQRALYHLTNSINTIHERTSDIIYTFILENIEESESPQTGNNSLRSQQTRQLRNLRERLRISRLQRRNAILFPLANQIIENAPTISPRRTTLPQAPPPPPPIPPPPRAPPTLFTEQASLPPPSPLSLSSLPSNNSVMTRATSPVLPSRRSQPRQTSRTRRSRYRISPEISTRLLLSSNSISLPPPFTAAQTTNRSPPSTSARATASSTLRSANMSLTTPLIRAVEPSPSRTRPSLPTRRNPYRRRAHRVTHFTNPLHDPPADLPPDFETPVRIRPSRNQISVATELLVYSDLSDNYHTICPIDQLDLEPSDYILRIRHCGHIFREMNLRRHFRNSPRCPICRFDVRDHETGANAIDNEIISSINNLFNTAVSNVLERHYSEFGTQTDNSGNVTDASANIMDSSNPALSEHIYGAE